MEKEIITSSIVSYARETMSKIKTFNSLIKIYKLYFYISPFNCKNDDIIRCYSAALQKNELSNANILLNRIKSLKDIPVYIGVENVPINNVLKVFSQLDTHHLLRSQNFINESLAILLREYSDECNITQEELDMFEYYITTYIRKHDAEYNSNFLAESILCPSLFKIVYNSLTDTFGISDILASINRKYSSPKSVLSPEGLESFYESLSSTMSEIFTKILIESRLYNYMKSYIRYLIENDLDLLQGLQEYISTIERIELSTLTLRSSLRLLLLEMSNDIDDATQTYITDYIS